MACGIFISARPSRSSCGKGLVRSVCHPAEPGLILVAGAVQRVLRVYAGHLGDLAEDEQCVADLLPDAMGTVNRLTGFHSLPQLGSFFVQLIQRTVYGVPVEARLHGPGDDFLRPPQGRQGVGDSFHGVRRGGISLFLLLLRFPAFQRLRTVGGLGGAEHMGMAEHQLLRHAVYHVVRSEVLLFLLHHGVEHDLKQHVPQLFLHTGEIVPVNGVQRLVGLLQKIPADGLMGLLPVPRTAAGRPEQVHDGEKILPPIAFFPLKIYHISTAFARYFNLNPLELLVFL